MSGRIRVGVLGCGAVGQAIAQRLAGSPHVSSLILADRDPRGATAALERVQERRVEQVAVEAVDARDPAQVAALARRADVVVNGTVPALNLVIMEGCLAGGASYIDMAYGDKDYGHPMFADQLRLDARFRAAGKLALCSFGIDPGASNLFAKRTADRMERVDWVKVRDADTGTVEGYELATWFSPESMLEEVLHPPLAWEDGRWVTTPPMEVNEVYPFPPPVGPQRVWRTDHEESELIPQFLGKPVGQVDFMITLDETFISHVKVLRKLGLTSFEPLDVKGTKVAPIDVVVAAMPRPDALAGKIRGHACVLVEVGGRLAGEDVVVRTWTTMSHEEAHALCGIHATAYQTGMPVVVAVEMMARGEVGATGVRSPEALDPVRFVGYLPGHHIAVQEEVLPADPSGSLKSRTRRLSPPEESAGQG